MADSYGPMRVVRLTADNFKRLVAVDITPDGDVVVVSGKNGAGKTSVLDAIWHALGGGAASRGTSQPIRDGETKAEVTVDLGDLTVTRSWTASGSTLTVRDAAGSKLRSPQKILDDLCGRIAFDPLEFSTASPREQRDMLVGVLDMPLDEAELASERQALFDERTEAGRWARSLAARADEYTPPSDGTPSEPVDVEALQVELTAAREAAGQARIAAHNLAVAVRDAEQAQARVVAARAALAEAETAADEAVAARDSHQAIVDNTGDIPDVEALEQQYAEAHQINTEIAAANTYRQRIDEAAEAQAHYEDLTRRIDMLDAKKTAALAKIDMPVEGLSFTDDEVLYQGVPFTQASAAERLRVSMAIGMAASPTVRVARITDGSLLDSDGMKIVAALAAEHDMQVWVERVSDGDGTGVRIEDGEVVEP